MLVAAALAETGRACRISQGARRLSVRLGAVRMRRHLVQCEVALQSSVGAAPVNTLLSDQTSCNLRTAYKSWPASCRLQAVLLRAHHCLPGMHA